MRHEAGMMGANDPLAALDRRIDELTAWLKADRHDVTETQRHLDADAVERAYWHYGYLVALRDVRDLLTAKRRSLN